MKKEWLLLIGSSAVTVLIALGGIRWFAPQLLGIPIDLQMVQVSEEVPPFFDGVFRQSDYSSKDFLIKDPYLNRGKPMLPDLAGMGPHDVLGFRNLNVPNGADTVTIGDSQTYGNNALIDFNWPSHLLRSQKESTGRELSLYNMSSGGWGAVEYLEIMFKSSSFAPKLVIVAFYSGNDPLDSFRKAYSDERWGYLRPNENLDATDAPAVTFPAPKTEQWPVKFSDGTSTTFTPTLRLAANDAHPAVHAGYKVMANVAGYMAELMKSHNVALLFTIIPTKELAYAKKVEDEGIENVPEDFTRLTEMETGNIKALATHLQSLPGASYVDLIAPLQQAALTAAQLYPPSKDGHPLAEGYRVIASALHLESERMVSTPALPKGLFATPGYVNSFQFSLIRSGRLWFFDTPQTAAENGWDPNDAPIVRGQALVNLSRGGIISVVDPQRFGPREAAQQRTGLTVGDL